VYTIYTYTYIFIYLCVCIYGSKHMALSEVVFSLAHFSFTRLKGVVCVEAGGFEGL